VDQYTRLLHHCFAGDSDLTTFFRQGHAFCGSRKQNGIRLCFQFPDPAAESVHRQARFGSRGAHAAESGYGQEKPDVFPIDLRLLVFRNRIHPCFFQ
jgi:hypothetical protein